MANIDDELIKALIRPNQYGAIGKESPLKRLIRLKIIDYDTEIDIGKNRTADILLAVRRKSKQHKVVIEVENDRKFDVGEVLRKIKRNKLYPTIVIIPKRFGGHSFRFKKSGIPVWYWAAACRWSCRGCNNITISDSSITPNQCSHCGKSGSHVLSWEGVEHVEFEEAESNPSINIDEYQIQAETIEQPLKIKELLLLPQWVGETKGYVGHVTVTNKGKKIIYDLTANVDVERDGIHPEVLEVSLVAEGRVTRGGKPITSTKKKEVARNVKNIWTNQERTIFSENWKKLRQDDSAILYFPETRSRAISHFSSFASDAKFLRIVTGVEHWVTISVKGEDKEKNTISATRTFRFKIEDKTEETGIYIT